MGTRGMQMGEKIEGKIRWKKKRNGRVYVATLGDFSFASHLSLSLGGGGLRRVFAVGDR